MKRFHLLEKLEKGKKVYFSFWTEKTGKTYAFDKNVDWKHSWNPPPLSSPLYREGSYFSLKKEGVAKIGGMF